MKLKVIHITASYKPAYGYGGPIQSVGKLCEALEEVKSKRLKIKAQNTKAIASLQVFTTTANGKEELPVEVGKPTFVDAVQVTYFKRWTKDHSHFSPGLLWALRKEILRCAQDDKLIIHIHAWWNLVSVLSCFIAKWYKIPVVLSPRGMLTAYSQTNRHSYFKKIIHLLIGKRLLEYCHIHATSEQEKNEIFKIVKPKSINVIWNLVGMEDQGARNKEQGVESRKEVSSSEYQAASNKYQDEIKGERVKDKAKSNEQRTWRTELGAGTKRFKLIFLSRIEEKKGLELLFDVLVLLNIEWVLTIAGTGEVSYVESLKAKAESLKLIDRINWIGHVSNEKKFPILADNDLLILPSYNENFANVVVESLSVGTAVLVSEYVGLADYVMANKFGWVCSSSPIDIKNKLNEAYNNSLIRDKIRHTAPEIINKDFSEEVLVEQYLGFYENVLRFRSV